MKIPVSVIIPVKNEERNIEACLKSLAWADEVFVVDSHSTDRTKEIASMYTDKIYDFEYRGGWPRKKGWALENLPIRNEWVFLIDADERVTPALAREIAGVVSSNTPHNGFMVNRKFYFMGRWIKHCGWWPSWNIRLIKKGKARFEKLTGAPDLSSGDIEVHEHLVVEGSVGYLNEPMIHEDLKGIYAFVEKHNRYSTWEADVYLKLRSSPGSGGVKPRFFGNPIEKKRFLKVMWVRMPFRPFLRFIYMYVLRLGFLDGYQGFVFSLLMSWHEFIINAKIREKQLLTKRGED